VKWYEAGGIEEVREWGQRSGCRSKSGGGEAASEGRRVSDDRGGGGVG
jgi:hypothetical protein